MLSRGAAAQGDGGRLISSPSRGSAAVNADSEGGDRAAEPGGPGCQLLRTRCHESLQLQSIGHYFLWKPLSNWQFSEIFIGSNYPNEEIKLVNSVLQKMCMDFQRSDSSSSAI